MQTMVVAGLLPRQVQQTATFLKEVNDTFDLLNIRSTRRRIKPLTASSGDIEKLQNIRAKVSSWRPKGKSKQPPCFQALQQSLYAMELLLHDLVGCGSFSYILSGRINQDCIENFFSQVRGRGGHRLNPSAREFRYAMRILSTNLFMTPISRANCLDDGDELLTSLSELSKQATSESRKRKRDDTCDVPAKRAKTCEDAPVLQGIDDFQLSSPVLNVVNYMAGYLLRKLQLERNCPNCFLKLSCKGKVVEKSNLLCHFKAYKHDDKSAFGSLFVPSTNFSKYLQRIEKKFQKHIDAMLCADKVLASLLKMIEKAVPFSLLPLCKEHRKGRLGTDILRCYVRCRLHYHFKFETRKLLQKPVKKNRKAQILMHK